MSKSKEEEWYDKGYKVGVTERYEMQDELKDVMKKYDMSFELYQRLKEMSEYK